MEPGETSGKRERRAAYAIYVDLFWALRRLEPRHPARAQVQDALRRAERHWRALMMAKAPVSLIAAGLSGGDRGRCSA